MNKLTVKPLLYDYNALEPVISKQIMELHHDKHYVNYINAFNAALDVGKVSSFNYNGAIMHEIFWENMRPAKENNLPPEGMFPDFEKFKQEFTTAAVTVEGSGWAVLWKTDSGLAVSQLEKHNLLGLNGAKPILVLDVWEHAYYLDYLNDRKSYIEKWWQVVNWDEVEKRI
ncbi:MAG: superoxide dismutase [Candidatus Shapirobacteria bacterium]|nr:superoxide dismutase [Candidatus Shapirobacteria bacterium]